MSEDQILYAPESCPAYTACVGCPNNVGASRCHPAALLRAGDLGDVLSGVRDVLDFLHRSVDSHTEETGNGLEPRALRGLAYIVADVAVAVDYCHEKVCAQHRAQPRTD